MLRSCLRTLLALLPVALVPSALAAQAPTDGVTYVVRNTASGSGPLGAIQGGQSGRVLVQGGKFRLEMSDSAPPPPFRQGNVMLMLEEGRMVVLDTTRREYFVIDPAAIMRRASDAQESGGMAMRITNPEARSEHLGAGEPILGQTTDRWRTTQRMTMVMTSDAMRLEMQSETSSETWFGETPLDAAASPATMAKTFVGDSALAQQIVAARAQLPNRIPLRTVTTMRMMRDGQEVAHSSSTANVTSVTRGPIPASTFVIPEGYREVPFPVPGGDR